MKRLIIISLFFVFVASGFALEVGDKMPDVSGVKIQETRLWYNYYNGQNGVFNRRYEKDLLSGDFAIDAYLVCDGTTALKPFGVFIEKDNSVYMDRNMDGIIDDVIRDPQISIGSTAPECPGNGEGV